VSPPEFDFSSEGTHVLTGAFGGFGLETAQWLADRGARHLVMVGRKGAASADAAAAVASLRKRGVNVMEAACDVGDRKQMEELFERISRDMPPVCGVMHAAMVLDDTVIANLEADRFLPVLNPKILGA